eukprot:m.55982 g.55982  ORF g.55982 m.55982 type:complete len:88 (-) comp11014_c0_seq2:1349-1612(-)
MSVRGVCSTFFTACTWKEDLFEQTRTWRVLPVSDSAREGQGQKIVWEEHISVAVVPHHVREVGDRYILILMSRQLQNFSSLFAFYQT